MRQRRRIASAHDGIIATDAQASFLAIQSHPDSLFHPFFIQAPKAGLSNAFIMNNA
jgi:hypothetical protein